MEISFNNISWIWICYLLRNMVVCWVIFLYYVLSVVLFVYTITSLRSLGVPFSQEHQSSGLGPKLMPAFHLSFLTGNSLFKSSHILRHRYRLGVPWRDILGTPVGKRTPRSPCPPSTLWGGQGLHNTFGVDETPGSYPAVSNTPSFQVVVGMAQCRL